MKRLVFVSLILFFLGSGVGLYSGLVPFPAPECLDNAYAQALKEESSNEESIALRGEEPPMREHGDGMMMREGMGETMRNLIPPKAVPFYQEKTFLVIITAVLVLFIVWVLRRWGIRPWRALGSHGVFVNEAVLVVDLCESTKLAVTQGDLFAMRITNKMKECVRAVSERFGASFFANTGDGYLIAFSAGVGAVRAAVKILQNADGYNKDAPEKERIELRVGISYGELALDEQGERHGAAINKAFRIEGLKKEDQQSMGGGLEPEDFPEKNRILVSEEIKEEIRDVTEIPVHQVGVFDLKGFTGLHRIYCIPWRDVFSD